MAKRVLRWGAASLLLACGLVLAVPGIPGPGLLLVILGFVLLLPESRRLRRAYVRWKRKHPRLFGGLERRRRRRREARVCAATRPR